jgi:hypothetical protein
MLLDIENNYSAVLDLIMQQVTELHASDKINLSRHFILEKHLKYANSSNSKAIVYQFSVSNIDRFIELTSHDINHLDKKIFSLLNLAENSIRVPRLQKFSGFKFSHAELANSLLMLNYEHGFDLYKASVYLPNKFYEEIKSECTYNSSGVMTIHNIPIYTDDPDDTRLPSNLICFTDKKQNIKVYNESINVISENKSVSIERYKMVVPDLKANKFFTIKV